MLGMTQSTNDIFKSPSDSKFPKIESQSSSYSNRNFMDSKLNPVQKTAHHSSTNLNQKNNCMIIRPDSHGKFFT